MLAHDNKDGTSFASSDSEPDNSWIEVSKPQLPRIRPEVQGPDEPWQYTPAAKSIRLPDASGHTTTLAFEVETKTNYKGCKDSDRYRAASEVGTWACGFTVNGAGNVVPWPAESEDKSFVLPDGDTLIGHWHVSREESKAGEQAVDIKSHGNFSVIVGPTGWRVNYGPDLISGAEPPTTETLADACPDHQRDDTGDSDFVNVNHVPLWR